jgi:hypothetical protein
MGNLKLAIANRSVPDKKLPKFLTLWITTGRNDSRFADWIQQIASERHTVSNRRAD